MIKPSSTTTGVPKYSKTSKEKDQVQTNDEPLLFVNTENRAKKNNFNFENHSTQTPAECSEKSDRLRLSKYYKYKETATTKTTTTEKNYGMLAKQTKTSTNIHKTRKQAAHHRC